MATKKQKLTGPKVQINTAATALKGIEAKFSRLKELRLEINKVKALYTEHDQIMEELLPLFTEVTPDTFIIRREVTIGTIKHRFIPFFYDEKKGRLNAKVWKSTAHEAGHVE